MSDDTRIILARHYDRLGRGQDSQLWYEGPALDVICAHGAFETARSTRPQHWARAGKSGKMCIATRAGWEPWL